MLMNYSIAQDSALHPDVLKEMVGGIWSFILVGYSLSSVLCQYFLVSQTALVEFYKDMHDFIDFNKVYKSELTYLEKLKVSECFCD